MVTAGATRLEHYRNPVDVTFQAEFRQIALLQFVGVPFHRLLTVPVARANLPVMDEFVKKHGDIAGILRRPGTLNKYRRAVRLIDTARGARGLERVVSFFLQFARGCEYNGGNRVGRSRIVAFAVQPVVEFGDEFPDIRELVRINCSGDHGGGQGYRHLDVEQNCGNEHQLPDGSKGACAIYTLCHGSRSCASLARGIGYAQGATPGVPFLRDRHSFPQTVKGADPNLGNKGALGNETWLKFLLDPDEILLGPYRFNQKTLDLRDRRGDRVKLRKKSLEVLACIARERGAVVSKDKILMAIWPDVVVTEENLTQCVAEIRRANRDKEQTVLVTHIGRGYSIDAKATSSSIPNRRLAVGAMVIAAILAAALVAMWMLAPQQSVPAHPRIAVLAFEDMSAGSDRGFLGDGVAESLTTELSRYRELRVIARNSSFQFRDSGLGVVEIAEALRADYLIEGSKQKSGDRLRVMVQLIDGHTSEHIWAEVFEGSIGDLFEFQNRIVHQITNRVGREVSRKPARSGGRTTVSALDFYFRGMAEFQKETHAGTLAARDLFQDAIDADPDAPFGYVGSVWVLWRDLWSNTVEPETPRADKLHRAAALADKALGIDPTYHLAHVARADIHVAAGELEAAKVRYAAALDLNPNDVLVMVGSTDPLVFLGEGDAAIDRIRRAIDLDPKTPGWYFHQLAWAEWSVGRCEAGLSTMRKMPVPSPSALRVLAALHVCVGDSDSARQAMDKFRETNPARTVRDEIADFSGSWRDPKMMESWSEAMRVAGMPEG